MSAMAEEKQKRSPQNTEWKKNKLDSDQALTTRVNTTYLTWQYFLTFKVLNLNLICSLTSLNVTCSLKGYNKCSVKGFFFCNRCSFKLVINVTLKDSKCSNSFL